MTPEYIYVFSSVYIVCFFSFNIFLVCRNMRQNTPLHPRHTFSVSRQYFINMQEKWGEKCKMTIRIHSLSLYVADLYNSPYLAWKKITFQLLLLCDDICWACRCLTQAWGEVQGVKIKEVLSPSDSNSTEPAGWASNVGLKLPVDVGLLHCGGQLGAQPLSTVQSLLRPEYRVEAAYSLQCIALLMWALFV